MDSDILKFSSAYRQDQILESSLSRVNAFVKDETRQFAIITAFRGEYSNAENQTRNARLISDIRGLGYGFFKVAGFFVENRGTENERKVSEDSLFVSTKNTDAAFRKNLVALCKKYDQEAIIVKDDRDVQLVDKSGGIIASFGKARFNLIGDFYTALHGGEKRSFVFESIEEAETKVSAAIKNIKNGGKAQF